MLDIKEQRLTGMPRVTVEVEGGDPPNDPVVKATPEVVKPKPTPTVSGELIGPMNSVH